MCGNHLNDSQDPVIITTNDDANCIFVLLPGDEKEFGDHHVKAKFTMLIKDSAGNYIQNVAVRQYACSAGKEIRLGAQELTSRHINPDLFIFGNPGTVDLRKREVCH